MSKLKKCPFRRANAGIYQDYTGFYTIQCFRCGIGTLHHASIGFLKKTQGGQSNGKIY